MGDTLPSWALGPFTRPTQEPIISPTDQLVFNCPMLEHPVRWAENHTFNPAAVTWRGSIHVLFRAEDGQGDDVGHYTSRIGRAVSSDGLSFVVHPEPVLYPARDEWIEHEWFGGCEDPRITELEDGSFAMYYTMFNRDYPVGSQMNAILGVATSTDLEHWTKHGPIFPEDEGIREWHKAAGVVQTVRDGRLVAAKIDGLYWIYWGEASVRIATSTDLLHWTPIRDATGALVEVIAPREGHFDSRLTEVGPNPVLTEDGIVLIYNGKNDPTTGDPAIRPGAYAAGQALFDMNEPERVLDRLETPFLKPELDFETTGQYEAGTVFTEGLVLHRGEWFLYYGMADSYVGVATARPSQPASS